mmetsp:Transcript_15605/g.38929  ORF Transcript_15605/g.38929 Transcript_15605/m.38929 type:complete len:101 (+) Transcript_15605:3753-4055(+)
MKPVNKYANNAGIHILQLPLRTFATDKWYQPICPAFAPVAYVGTSVIHAQKHVTTQIRKFILMYRKKKYPSSPETFRTVSHDIPRTSRIQFCERTSGNDP